MLAIKPFPKEQQESKDRWYNNRSRRIDLGHRLYAVTDSTSSDTTIAVMPSNADAIDFTDFVDLVEDEVALCPVAAALC